ncbi:hypothetical protein IWW48_003800 [Coemansia sp. RSA 1200]|nr:hypothetical protein IWW48_003800 [Coemansia sp. RSA 1200]
MHRSNAYLGPYHRSLPIVNPNQKDSAAEEQEEEARSPRLSLTAPLAQTSRSIRVHQVSHPQLGPSVVDPTNASIIATDSHQHYHHHSNGPSLPSISSLYGDGNAVPSIAAGRPVVPQPPYYRQPTVAAPPQFSYRNHYQQNPPPPLLPRLSVSYSVGSSNGSSAVSPSTPTHSRQQQQQYCVPSLSSPTATTLTSPSASPVGGNAYVFGGKRTHEEMMAGIKENATTTNTSSVGQAAGMAQLQLQLQQPARKRSRHAWPAKMTRQIINVLLDEFLKDPGFRTTIYRSREERDFRFAPSGRTILEEYNKVQNMRRRYFIPLSYLLQWEQLNSGSSRLEHESEESSPAEGPDSALRARQRCNIEKKLAKPLERSRLQMIFCSAMKGGGDELAAAGGGEYEVAGAAVEDDDDDTDEDADDEGILATGGDVAASGKPVFELDIFVKELKRRDIQLWARSVNAFHAWVSRKCSIGFIINH